MERTERSFEKNVKERKERNVLLKRTDAQPWAKLSLINFLATPPYVSHYCSVGFGFAQLFFRTNHWFFVCERAKVQIASFLSKLHKSKRAM